MKTYDSQPQQTTRTLNTNSQVSRQASWGDILQRQKEPAQRKEADEEEEVLQGKLGTSSAATVQRAMRPNHTGLPDNLKAGVESLSGFSMDDVRVHYNSDRPAQLQALAYTQGTDIYMAPGQERHLPHEAWHVVQQMQGRVQPTMQLKGVNVNDDSGLEGEADVMGERTLCGSKRECLGSNEKMKDRLCEQYKKEKEGDSGVLQLKPTEEQLSKAKKYGKKFIEDKNKVQKSLDTVKTFLNNLVGPYFGEKSFYKNFYHKHLLTIINYVEKEYLLILGKFDLLENMSNLKEKKFEKLFKLLRGYSLSGVKNSMTVMSDICMKVEVFLVTYEKMLEFNKIASENLDMTKLFVEFKKVNTNGNLNEINSGLSNLLKFIDMFFRSVVRGINRGYVNNITCFDNKYFEKYLLKSKPKKKLYRGTAYNIGSDFIKKLEYGRGIEAFQEPWFTFAGVYKHVMETSEKNGMISTTTSKKVAKTFIGDNYGVIYEILTSNYVNVTEVLRARNFHYQHAKQFEMLVLGDIKAEEIIGVSLYGKVNSKQEKIGYVDCVGQRKFILDSSEKPIFLLLGTVQNIV